MEHTMEKITLKQFLEAGAHYGHDTRRWNPKMAPYIYKKFNKVHIIDLRKTAPMMATAMQFVKETVAKGGRILFVGTKRQASPIIKEYAEKCAQYYINHRWLGGLLTNWKTVSQSINTLVELEKLIESGMKGYTKKEQLSFKRKAAKLELTLGGIRKMGGLPSAIVVIDAKKESIAIAEANRLKIPVVAIVDTNSDPDNVKYPVPANDDSIKAIQLYCQLFSSAVLSGLEEEAKHMRPTGSSKAATESKTNAKAPETKGEKAQEPKAEVAEVAEVEPSAKEEAAPAAEAN